MASRGIFVITCCFRFNQQVVECRKQRQASLLAVMRYSLINGFVFDLSFNSGNGF